MPYFDFHTFIFADIWLLEHALRNIFSTFECILPYYDTQNIFCAIYIVEDHDLLHN